MNKQYILIVLFFVFGINLMQAQITGKFLQDDYPYPWVKVYFEGISGKASSNFEGDFKLKIRDTLTSKTLNIDFDGLKIQILNCPLKKGDKLDLGTIILPKYKKITVETYQEQRRRYRKQCVPLYNGSTLIGYVSKTELENPSLRLHCNEEQFISDFTFDYKSKAITLDWVAFSVCN